MNKKILSLLLILVILSSLIGCSLETAPIETPLENTDTSEYDTSENQEDIELENSIKENGYYTSPEDVSQYINVFGNLPSNFITKKEAEDLGWESKKGNLWDVTDKMSIGGDRFGNREGLLPKADKRQYYEADVNYEGGYRGSERIVFSNDGLIFYTGDHYDSFEQLY
ncbi:MAG: ribonuclease domain-containing protein [Tissierellia bacterium]|mgnify:CR=1 FL=1|nr:ribonuclease domain-containing protein [Tissierellia bacterium]MDD4726650.1 ribonuclease domain-containing protein [Tissierellia bacterium]